MEPPIRRGKPSAAEIAYDDAFREEVIKQPERFDELARELFKLELAVPGVYIAALMVASITVASAWLMSTFLLWFMALALTLISLFPKQYKKPGKKPGHPSFGS